MAKSIVPNNGSSAPIGSTGQLKRAIAATIIDADRMAGEISRITQICDELDIPAESDDGQPYRLAERVRQLADLAELVLIGDEGTDRGRQLRREIEQLKQRNHILNQEIEYIRQQGGPQ